MRNIRCYCCEKGLPEGSLKYVVEIKSFADFDGHLLPDYSGDIEADMMELLEEMDEIDAKALEGDVYKELVFILCKGCRGKFLKNPFNNSGETAIDEESKDTVH